MSGYDWTRCAIRKKAFRLDTGHILIDSAYDYKCFVCGLFAFVPVSCGHCPALFCTDCVQKKGETKTVFDCSCCLAKSTVLARQNENTRAMAQFQVRCVHFNEEDESVSCGWTGQMGVNGYHLLDHLMLHCPQEKVTCSNDECDAGPMLRKYIDRHATQDCLFREGYCFACKKNLIYRDMKAHLDFCPQVPIPCVYCPPNDNRWPRGAIRVSHYEVDCPYYLFACPFQCGVMDLNRDNLELHMKNAVAAHLLITQQQCAALIDKMNERMVQVEEEKKTQQHKELAYSTLRLMDSQPRMQPFLSRDLFPALRLPKNRPFQILDVCWNKKQTGVYISMCVSQPQYCAGFAVRLGTQDDPVADRNGWTHCIGFVDLHKTTERHTDVTFVWAHPAKDTFTGITSLCLVDIHPRLYPEGLLIALSCNQKRLMFFNPVTEEARLYPSDEERHMSRFCQESVSHPSKLVYLERTKTLVILFTLTELSIYSGKYDSTTANIKDTGLSSYSLSLSKHSTPLPTLSFNKYMSTANLSITGRYPCGQHKIFNHVSLSLPPRYSYCNSLTHNSFYLMCSICHVLVEINEHLFVVRSITLERQPAERGMPLLSLHHLPNDEFMLGDSRSASSSHLFYSNKGERLAFSDGGWLDDESSPFQTDRPLLSLCSFSNKYMLSVEADLRPYMYFPRIRIIRYPVPAVQLPAARITSEEKLTSSAIIHPESEDVMREVLQKAHREWFKNSRPAMQPDHKRERSEITNESKAPPRTKRVKTPAESAVASPIPLPDSDDENDDDIQEVPEFENGDVSQQANEKFSSSDCSSEISSETDSSSDSESTSSFSTNSDTTRECWSIVLYMSQRQEEMKARNEPSGISIESIWAHFQAHPELGLSDMKRFLACFHVALHNRDVHLVPNTNCYVVTAAHAAAHAE